MIAAMTALLLGVVGWCGVLVVADDEKLCFAVARCCCCCFYQDVEVKLLLSLLMVLCKVVGVIE
jgi:hypothetical protein